ncbi:MAG TPA: segregation/condensation protein A [Clostridia bacterium]|nr:segregation/condensation protein A [Clostridia bacterium]
MAYEVHLKEFDGPLDLLLHLIEEAKVDIKDIFVSEITNQYLAFMEEVDALDMETASEFLTMAATLVYIKSRTLLPRPQKIDEDEEDPEAVLLRQLRDYKLFKQAGEGLVALREGMRSVYARLPEEFLLPPQEYNLSDATAQELFAAFAQLLRRTGDAREDASAQSVAADRYTVRNQLAFIRARLSERQTLTFEELFEGAREKLELVVTFMALLEMITRQEIILRQKTPYGRITITAWALREDDEDYEYMDELK